MEYLEAEAIYIDEFGFGWKTSPYKTCTNKIHFHQSFDLQVGELLTLKALHLKLGAKKINIYV